MRTRQIVDDIFGAMHEYAALDILVQGYDASARLQKGEDPFPGQDVSDKAKSNLKVPTKEQSDSLFDLDDVGIDGEELLKNYEFALSICGVLNNNLSSKPELKQLRDKIHDFATNENVRSFIEAMSEKRYDDARNPEIYTAFRNAYVDVMNECNNLMDKQRGKK